MFVTKKRVLAALLVVVFLLTSTGISFASDSSTNDGIFTTNKIIEPDFKEFFSKAVLSHYDSSGVKFTYEDITRDGVIAITNVTAIPTNSKQSREFIAAAQAQVSSRASQHDFQWDSTSIVKIWTTVYYDTSTINGISFVDIDRVEGGIYSSLSPSGSYVGDSTYILKSQEL